MAFSGGIRYAIGFGTSANSASTTIVGNVSEANGTHEVGRLVVVTVVTDNSTTTAGDSTEFTVTDSKGHTWTRAKEQTQGGSANTSVTVGIFYTILTSAIVVGDTITCTFSSRSARMISGFSIGMSAGSSVTVVNPVGQGGSGTPASIAHTAAVSGQEYFAVVLHGIEMNSSPGSLNTFEGSTSGVTGDSNWTTGGSSTANIANANGLVVRTVSNTTPTWSFAGTPAAGDHRLIAVLFLEVLAATSPKKIRVVRTAINRAALY